MIPIRAAVIVGAVLLVLGMAFGAGWWANGVRWEVKHVKAESAWLHEREAQADAARHSLEVWTKQKAEAEANYAKDIQARDARIAALTRTADGLRSAAEKRAGGGPDDSLTACRADAAALRDVLSGADSEAGRLAEAADRHASEVRALLEAWPK